MRKLSWILIPFFICFTANAQDNKEMSKEVEKVKPKIEKKLKKAKIAKIAKKCYGKNPRKISCANIENKKRDFFCWKAKKKIGPKKIKRICKTDPSLKGKKKYKRRKNK